MLPYFFSASHHNYARYSTYQLNGMNQLSSAILEKLLRCEHTPRNQKEIWDGIWSDIFMETLFMRFGKDPGCMVCVPLIEASVKTWSFGLHICKDLLYSLAKKKEPERTPCS